MIYYLNNFLLFSILGFLFENVTFKILNMHNYSGFSYLWWTPFYGIGVIIVNIINNYFNKHLNSIKNKNIILFITFFIVLSIVEFLGGYLLNLSHGYKMWTYKNIPFHIGEYISVPTSLLWATMAFIYLFIIKKFTDKLIKFIPKWLTIILSLLFLSDMIFTMVRIYINRI